MDIQYVIICAIVIVLLAAVAIFWPNVKSSVDESQVKFISEKMLPDDIAYTSVPENHIKAIVDQGGNLVKFVMNVKGKSFDKDWNIIDSEVPDPATPALYGTALPDGTIPLIRPAGMQSNPEIDTYKNDLVGIETPGMRSMGSLPGVNKVLEYPFSWQRLNGQVEGEWIIKIHTNEMVKQMIFVAQYVFTLILDTKENFEVRYFIRITTEVKNPKKTLIDINPIGSWIDKLSGMLYNTFEEFTTATFFNEIREDIAKPDFDTTDAAGNKIPGSVLSKKVFGLNSGDKKGPHTGLISGIGEEIIGFEIIEFGWPKNSPVAKALEQEGIYKKDQEALKVKLLSEKMQADQDAYKIKATKVAESAGKLEENISEADLIKKKNDAAIELLEKQNKAAIDLLGKKNEAEVNLIKEKTAVENKAAIDLLKEKYDARGKLVKDLKEKGVSEETIQAMFISEMSGLLSYGEKGIGLVTNVDDKKGGNKGDNKPVAPPEK